MVYISVSIIDTALIKIYILPRLITFNQLFSFMFVEAAEITKSKQVWCVVSQYTSGSRDGLSKIMNNLS